MVQEAARNRMRLKAPYWYYLAGMMLSMAVPSAGFLRQRFGESIPILNFVDDHGGAIILSIAGLLLIVAGAFSMRSKHK